MVILFYRLLVCSTCVLWYSIDFCFSVLHNKPLIIDMLLNESSINVNQLSAFNQTSFEIGADKEPQGFKLATESTKSTINVVMLKRAKMHVCEHCGDGPMRLKRLTRHLRGTHGIVAAHKGSARVAKARSILRDIFRKTQMHGLSFLHVRASRF